MKLEYIDIPSACGDPDCALPCEVGYTVEPGYPETGGPEEPYSEAEPDYVLVYRLNGDDVWPHCCAVCGALITEESLSRLVTDELGELA